MQFVLTISIPYFSFYCRIVPIIMSTHKTTYQLDFLSIVDRNDIARVLVHQAKLSEKVKSHIIAQLARILQPHYTFDQIRNFPNTVMSGRDWQHYMHALMLKDQPICDAIILDGPDIQQIFLEISLAKLILLTERSSKNFKKIVQSLDSLQISVNLELPEDLRVARMSTDEIESTAKAAEELYNLMPHFAFITSLPALSKQKEVTL